MPRRARVEDLFPVGDTPLCLDPPSSPRVWDLPMDPAWWCEHARRPDANDSLNRLQGISGKAYAKSRARFAFEVARAYSQVRSWERSGVAIRGRRWVDLGGDDGAFLVALRACGASEATLVDLKEPVAAALPVLEAGGVRVVVGDMRRIAPIDADAVCFLYVTLPLDVIFRVIPAASVVVIDQFFSKRDAHMLPTGWTARKIRAVELFHLLDRSAMGDRPSVALARSREPRIIWERSRAPSE